MADPQIPAHAQRRWELWRLGGGRDWSLDWQRLSQTGYDVRSAGVALGPDAGVQAGVAGVTPGGAVQSGPLASRVVQIARSLKNSANTNYYPDPAVACASFVSTVLIQAGILERREFNPYCPTLAPELLRDGYRQVLPSHTAISQTAVAALQPGDVLFYSDGSGRFRHTEIYVGNGRTIGTSSSRGVVLEKTLLTYPSWRFIAAFRRPE